MEDAELKKVIETLLFITDAPLPVSRIGQLCEIRNNERLNAVITELKNTYDSEDRTLQLMQVAGGWQMATRPEYGIWVRKLYHNKMTVRLTQAALETLCIIAYKQPLTRVEIEAIRGVEVIGPLDTLTQRKLITVVGRRESIGRPILYGTTSEFLRQFGLNSLDDLPKLESFNIENPVLAAQTTAVEMVEQDPLLNVDSGEAVETVAEGAPPADPMAGAEPQAEAELPAEGTTSAESPAAQEAAPEAAVEAQADVPASEPEPVMEQPAEAPAQEPDAAEASIPAQEEVTGPDGAGNN